MRAELRCRVLMALVASLQGMEGGWEGWAMWHSRGACQRRCLLL